jgi:hypothetical protein
MDAKQYLHEMQAIEVDEASANQYVTMVSAINAQVIAAATSRLRFDDEPAHYLRLLGTERRNDG